jgi:hypothetical protein
MRLGGVAGKAPTCGNEITVKGRSSIYTDGGEMSILYDTVVDSNFPASADCAGREAFANNSVAPDIPQSNSGLIPAFR